jgi:hypothetical protein
MSAIVNGIKPPTSIITQTPIPVVTATVNTPKSKR